MEGGSYLTVFSKSKSRDIIIRPMTLADIEEVRTVSQIAWTDLATRDAGRKVRYPKRSARLIEAYMWKEPQGCLVVETEGKVIGSAFCHVWGRVGWIGPLEVLPYHQDLGVGKALLHQCEAFLNSRKCEVIGLETMPHLSKNLHFYLSAGYCTSDLTVIVEKILGKEVEQEGNIKEVKEQDLPRILPQLSELSEKVEPNLDYSREWEMVIGKDLGTGLVYISDGKLRGAALLHTYQRMEDEDYASIKMLLTDPELGDGQAVFSSLLDKTQHLCKDLGKTRIMTRFPVKAPLLYNFMTARGYFLKGSNIRMLKLGDYREKGTYNLSSWAG